MQIRRGDIWYISKGVISGCEQQPGRPAVVVSNDKNNQFSSTVEVVYLTTRPKKDLPTHVLITSIEHESIVLCEQVTTVAVERLVSYRGHVLSDEMKAIDEAIRVSLGLQEAKYSNNPPPSEYRLARVEAECSVLYEMYDGLLNKIIRP